MSSEFAVSETTPLRTTSSSNIVTRTNLNNNNIRLETRLSAGHSAPPKMDNRKVLCKVAIDVTILLVVGFPILFFYLWGEPYKRGFFCNDNSLRHPFHESTVKNWMLYIIGLAVPIGIIIGSEIIHANRKSGNSTSKYTFFDWDVPQWMVEAYKQIGVFGFGAAVSQLTTDIAKYSIGRLRPHFISVCNPVMPDGSNCTTHMNEYIEDFKCNNPKSTARMIKEMRLSFPSGHSSFSFYTMVYCTMYLQSKLTWRGSKLTRHFLQFLLIMLAWATCLSRVSNYKHHWSDVLAGALLGSTCAILVATFVSDLFDKKNEKSHLPATNQDLQTSLHTTNGRA